MNKSKVPGILIAASGVIYLINPAQASFSPENTIGDLMIIANGFYYAAYLAISKDLIKRNGALRSLAWLFLLSSFVCVPIGIASLSTVEFSQVGAVAWLTLGFIVLFPTIAAYYLNAWALARVEPSIVAVYIYLQPLVGFALAVILLGEPFTVRAIAAGLLIFAGVFLVTRKETDNDDASQKQQTLH